MSVDVKGERLFVSALGNNTLEVIDTKAGKRVKTINGLQEPQGVLYVPATDRLYVANSKDGSVRIFDGSSYAPLKTLDYGDDADNLRYDPDHKRIYVGYGGGALAEIDEKGNKAGEIKLDSHPESFQLEKGTPRIYVNLPKSRKIAVLDREAHTIVTTWPLGMTLANYPMALDEADHRLFVVTRYPARLLVFDEHGKTRPAPARGRRCDDVFYDKPATNLCHRWRRRVSVFEQRIRSLQGISEDHHVKGANRFLFSDLDRLFVAVRRQGTRPAAIASYAGPLTSQTMNSAIGLSFFLATQRPPLPVSLVRARLD